MNIFTRKFVPVKLVQRIDAKNLNAGQIVEFLRRQDCMHFALGSFGSRVAVAEGKRSRSSVGLQPHVVNRPTIDGDGGDTFGSEFRAESEAPENSIKNGRNIPAEFTVN